MSWLEVERMSLVEKRCCSSNKQAAALNELYDINLQPYTRDGPESGKGAMQCRG